MYDKKKREVIFFVAAFCIFAYHPCRSGSLGELQNGFRANAAQKPRWIRLDPGGNRFKFSPDIRQTTGQKQHKHKMGFTRTSLELTSVAKEATLRHLQENGLQLETLSWSSGNVSQHRESRTYKSGKGYQSDYTGFRPVRGEILGVSPDTTHLSEWLAMRPLLHCDQNAMTFTASGGGFTNLFVGRDGGAPISLFDLPSVCGYQVKTEWGDLEMTVPYDACYTAEQDGSIVQQLDWWGNPVKLSCPVRGSRPPPSVYCLPYGMLLQIIGKQEDLPMMGFKVNGRWGPLIIEECASLISSENDKLLLYIPKSAACLSVDVGLHLWLIIDEFEYTLSCPEFPPVPPSFPSEPPFALFPAPVNPPAPPQTPPHLGGIHQHRKLPQVYPPGPQPPSPLMPYVERGFMKPFEPHLFSGKKPFLTAPDTFVSPPNVHGAPSQAHNPSAPYLHPGPPPPPKMLNSHHHHHHHHNSHFFPMPYHFTLQTTQVLSGPLQAVHPKPPPPAYSPTPPFTDVSHSPFNFYHQISVSVVPPSSDVQPALPHRQCFPYGHKSCFHSPSPKSPYGHPPQAPVQHPLPQAVQHYCLTDKMFVLLPFALPHSIQVKDQSDVWHFVSDVHPRCLYEVHASDGAGAILQTPLPSCHMYSQRDSPASLSLSYWDTSLAHLRTVDVQCPKQISAPPPQVRSPKPVAIESPKESCSANHMTIEFPDEPIVGIDVKDLYGNRIKLQDVSLDCGYSLNMGTGKKLRLTIPLGSQCHMTLQGSMYTITIVYRVYDETREFQFSCPGGEGPTSAQECNLPHDKRLPCGHLSITKPQCISMGCCFSDPSSACYYPMDECTADKHFVFSVPASLTEPPLSLPLLIAGGDSSCKPVRVTSDHALFKIPMDACGARKMQVGKTLIYILEVNNIVNSISLNYGTITRDSPVRLMVECRFLPGSALTVSYMVKTPTLGPAIQTQGIFGVQLRIAKDSEYKTFYPEDYYPLKVLLGKVLHLEVRLLNSPDPSLVLLVPYCVAYPRSVKAAWSVIFEGCPNPKDHPNQVVVLKSKVPVPAQTRRFTMRAFKFLPDGGAMDSNEEVYIMCGTELCSPRNGPCDEQCFGQ